MKFFNQSSQRKSTKLIIKKEKKDIKGTVLKSLCGNVRADTNNILEVSDGNYVDDVKKKRNDVDTIFPVETAVEAVIHKTASVASALPIKRHEKKMSSREWKKTYCLHQKNADVIIGKIEDRCRRSSTPLCAASAALMLGHMAYDNSRSGSVELSQQLAGCWQFVIAPIHRPVTSSHTGQWEFQCDDIYPALLSKKPANANASSSQDKPVHQCLSSNVLTAMSAASCYAEAILLMSLSGLIPCMGDSFGNSAGSNLDLYHVLFLNYVSCMEQACFDCVFRITNTLARINTPQSAITGEINDHCIGIIKTLESLGVAGLPPPPGYVQTAHTGDVSVSANPGSVVSQDLLGLFYQELIVNVFACFVKTVENTVPVHVTISASSLTTVKRLLQCYIGGHSESLALLSDNPGYWLHTSIPGLSPLTALWLHSIKQKKIRVATGKDSSSQDNPGTSSGIRMAKLVPVLQPSAINGNAGGDVLWGGDSPVLFEDMYKPLVIDVGCGFGVFLLGLAADSRCQHPNRNHNSDKYYGHNFLGCDLSSHCIGYASALASRWNMSSFCRFSVAPAESFLSWVLHHYPGPIVCVSLLFPTPYRLILPDANKNSCSKKNKMGKNVQLPSFSMNMSENTSKNKSMISAHDLSMSGFMVNPAVVSLVLKVAHRRLFKGVCSQSAESDACDIYLQSNVEDVAVTMKMMFENVLQEEYNATLNVVDDKDLCVSYLKPWENFAGANTKSNDTNILAESHSSRMIISEVGSPKAEVNTPRRQLDWAKAGGALAIGKGWLAASPMPFAARTETEAAYAVANKPIYRIGWSVTCRSS